MSPPCTQMWNDWTSTVGMTYLLRVVNSATLNAMTIAAGVTCPVVDVAKVRQLKALMVSSAAE